MENNSSHITKQHKEFLTVLGYAYLKNNKPEKAIIVYKALWHMFPKSALFIFTLSYLYLKTEQFQLALFFAEKCQTIGTDSTQALGYLLKSSALLKLGLSQEAQKTIELFLHKRMGKN